MTIAVGHRNVASAAAGAVFLLGCFAVGVLTVRTSMALMLIYALGCLIIYLTKPQGMVWIALFLAFASLPAALHRSKDIGPVGIYDYQVAILLAIVFLIPLARLRFSAYVVPGGFLLTVAFFAAAGVAGGSDPVATAREAMFLCDLVTGFVLALLIVRTNYVRESMRVMAVVLWFSAGMMLASSLTGLRLEGRAESLQARDGKRTGDPAADPDPDARASGVGRAGGRADPWPRTVFDPSGAGGSRAGDHAAGDSHAPRLSCWRWRPVLRSWRVWGGRRCADRRCWPPSPRR